MGIIESRSDIQAFHDGASNLDISLYRELPTTLNLEVLYLRTVLLSMRPSKSN